MMDIEELAEMGRAAHQSIIREHSERTHGKTFASFEDAQNRAWLAAANAIKAGVLDDLTVEVERLAAENEHLKRLEGMVCPDCHGVGERTVFSGQTPDSYQEDTVECGCITNIKDEAYQRGQLDMLTKVKRLMNEADTAHREYDETWEHFEQAISAIPEVSNPPQPAVKDCGCGMGDEGVRVVQEAQLDSLPVLP